MALKHRCNLWAQNIFVLFQDKLFQHCNKEYNNSFQFLRRNSSKSFTAVLHLPELTFARFMANLNKIPEYAQDLLVLKYFASADVKMKFCNKSF